MKHDGFIMKALGVKYKELSNYAVVKEFEKLFEDWGSPLGAYHNELLHSEWCGEYGRLPFEAYVWSPKEAPKRNILDRLSAIPLVVWLALLLLFVPFKWLVTGKASYSPKPDKKGVIAFTVRWIDRCFDRR